jgi:hypothetical protein
VEVRIGLGVADALADFNGADRIDAFVQVWIRQGLREQQAQVVGTGGRRLRDIAGL